MIKLGVNIDHVATLRQARIQALFLFLRLMLKYYLIHQVKLFYQLKHYLIPVGIEMACSDDIINIAIDVHPNTCTIVPEKRQEITTEGGLDAAGQYHLVADFLLHRQ